MKKAKEYAKGLVESNLNDKSIFDTVISLLDEVKEISETRHAKFASVLISIIKEQDLKWKAIVKIVNESKELNSDRRLDPEGFMSFVKRHFPFLVPYLEEAKNGR